MSSTGLEGYGVRLAIGGGAEAVELSYQVLDNAPIGMALVDEGGAVHWANTALCTIAGVPAGWDADLAIDDLVGMDALGDALTAIAQGQQQGVQLETPWRDVGGGARWVSIHLSLATDPAGTPLELGPDRRTAMILQAIDVTDRREAEEERAALRTQLTDRNRELERSNKDLEAFAYVASHDLSEPLRVISGHVHLLANRYGEALDDDADRWIGFAVDGCVRMRALIDGLLRYSRVGRTGLQAAPVDMAQVVQRALSGLATAVQDAEAVVDVGPMPVVDGDAEELQQLIANLVGNAVKYRKPDRPPHVQVTARPQGTGWRMCIADDGIGIPERHRDRVFGLFQRLHQREAYEGTGLGLAIARKVVDRHGGEIWIEDGLDGGSAVCFTLPGHPAAEDDAQEEARP